ncbi:MAG: hypothetical protein HEP71_30475 [Roseivirga sp.]|nr:hypothetical protein [Roseivirga sp.]
MVFVENKSSYINHLLENGEQKNVVDYLFRDYKATPAVTNYSDARAVSDEILAALAIDNKSRFESAYEAFSSRKPTAKSHWIYNDFLILLLIAGTKKFQVKNDWLHEVIDLRAGGDAELKKVTHTFTQLLNGNSANTERSFQQIEFVYLFLSGQSNPSNLDLNRLYSNLTKMPFPFYESDFVNVCSLKAIDLIITWKGFSDQEGLVSYKSFLPKFLKRTDSFGKWIVNTIIFILLSGLGYLIYYAIKNPDNKLISLVFTLMGTLGLSVIGLFKARKKTREILSDWIRKQLGYNKV